MNAACSLSASKAMFQVGSVTCAGWATTSPATSACSPPEETSRLACPGECPGVGIAVSSPVSSSSPSISRKTPRSSSAAWPRRK